jgi:hypothetical protein
MAATARLKDVTLKQEYGVYTGLDASYTVTGLTSSTIAEGAIEALGTVGAYGTAFSGSSNLIIVEKTAKLVDYSSSASREFTVDVKYVPYGELQDNWVWSWEVSLSQKQRNTDIFGLPLSVEYTYPSDYQLRPELADATVQAGATVTTDYAIIELIGRKIISTNTPTVYINQWLNYVNTDAWGPFGARDCRVARVAPKLLDISTSPHKYLFEVVIQCKGDGWDSNIAFTDPNTGEMPTDATPGTGYKGVFTHFDFDFNTVWPLT